MGLNQVGVDCGVRLENIYGNVGISGWSDGTRFQMRGELALDSLTCRDHQFTQVLGPFWIDDQEAMFGSLGGAARQPALAAGPAAGRLAARDRQDLRRDDLRRRLDVARCAAALQCLGKARRCRPGHVRPRAGRQQPQPPRTDLAATWNCDGFGHNRTALGGNGSLHLHDANIYELPVMISMLKILSIKAPDPNAFSQSDIDFRIEGEHVYFDKLDFKGDAISLLGKGEMDFQGDTHMVLAATVGHADAGMPALRNLFSRSESTNHADPRHRQLAESRHPPGSVSRREPGIEERYRRTDEHRTSFQHRRQRGGNFPGPDPGFRNRPCPAGEHRAGASRPKRGEGRDGRRRRPDRRRQPPDRRARRRRPAVVGVSPAARPSRTPAAMSRLAPGQDPTGQSGSMLDLSG